MTELKEQLMTCPCCKSPARLQTEKGVRGKVCLSQYFRQFAHCKNKKCGLTTTTFKRPGLATKAWNTRADDRPVQSCDDGKDELVAALDLVFDHFNGVNSNKFKCQSCHDAIAQALAKHKATGNNGWNETKHNKTMALEWLDKFFDTPDIPRSIVNTIRKALTDDTTGE